MLFRHNNVTKRKPQSGTLTGRLGGEEGLQNLGFHSIGNESRVNKLLTAGILSL